MIKLFNTASRKKQSLIPIKKNEVSVYVCGPTVYNYAHIGNLRTYIFGDVLHRTLRYAGFNVKYIMNITDVDDKTIRDANNSNETLQEFTKKYEKVFYTNLEKLNIKKASRYPRATDHIGDMVKLISMLLKKKFAYQKNGSVYFDISKFKNYGKLSRVQQKKLKTGVRIDIDEYEKNNVHDFVLWKTSKNGEPSWKTPFGEGRPGWHIECSAMSMKYLGKSFDIHAGGVDLIFPHHENEIAQSEGATGSTFAKLWLHGEHLLVEGKKMSKSLNNVFRLCDIESKHINPLAFRYLILTAHYRSIISFSFDTLFGAEEALLHLYDTVARLKTSKKTSKKSKSVTSYEKAFVAALYNDLNTPKAISELWKLIHKYNKNPENFNPKEVLKMLLKFDEVLGFKLKEIHSGKISTEIENLIKEREGFRKQHHWARADKIRDIIQKKGYQIEDSPTGSIAHKTRSS
jgi:cysteinyl-tRNA synthetase